MILRLLGLATLVTLSGVVTCASNDAPPPPTDQTKVEVQMRAISYSPRELTVHVGDTVVWRNADIVRHNAVRPDLFDTGELKPGESYTWVPADTGTYRYHCTIHQRMKGRIAIVSRP